MYAEKRSLLSKNQNEIINFVVVFLFFLSCSYLNNLFRQFLFNLLSFVYAIFILKTQYIVCAFKVLNILYFHSTFAYLLEQYFVFECIGFVCRETVAIVFIIAFNMQLCSLFSAFISSNTFYEMCDEGKFLCIANETNT